MPVVGGGDPQPQERRRRQQQKQREQQQQQQQQQQLPPQQQQQLEPEQPPPRLPWLNSSMQNNSSDLSGAEGVKGPVADIADVNGSTVQPFVQAPPVSPKPWLNVCVLVVKEDSGFGMTVTGDNPVYVEYVKPDGAAAKAGVVQGDKIAKVNGVVVINSNHAEVVTLIKASSSVALTLLRKPADSAQKFVEVPPSSKSPLRKVITDPIAVSAELEQSVAKERISNLRRMVDQAKEDEERAKAEFARNKTQKNSDRWTEAKKTLESVEQQLLAAANQLHSGSSLSGNAASLMEAPAGWHALPNLELPAPSSGSASPTSQSVGGQRRFEFRLTRRSNSVASFGLGAPPPPCSPTPAAAAAAVMQPLEEPGHRVVATRIASQNMFMASSADVPDCNVIVLPPPVVVMPSIETDPISIVLDNEDETSLKGSSEVKSSSAGYGHSLSAAMRSPLLPSESGSALFQAQANIISMEDDEFPAEQLVAVKDHGPFNDLDQLKKRHAHCAIFLSYLASNCDPSALLFHLVTDGYMQGNLREMKKWAYEIYSSFIAKDSPLQVKMDDAVLRTIETVLEKKSDKEDAMRSLFIQARTSCQAELLIDLADFRSKRDIGLSTFYGESDLYDGMDPAAELRVSEKLLSKLYSQCRTNTSPRGECMCSSLVTLIREWGMQKVAASSGSSGGSGASLDRVPSFLMKDRSSFKDILSGKVSKTKKEVIKNHSFSPQTYHSTTYCDMCSGILWGVGVQGLQCQACEMNVHRDCMQQIDACLKKRRPRAVPQSRRNVQSLIPTVPSLAIPASNQTTISTTDKEEQSSGNLPSPSKKKEDDVASFSDLASHGVDRLVERFERSGSALASSTPAFNPKPESSPDRQTANRHVRAKSSVESLDFAAAHRPPSAAAKATVLRPGPAAVGRSGSFNDKTNTRSELMQLVKNIRVSRSDVDQDRGAALEAIDTDARRKASSVSSLSEKSDPDNSEVTGTLPFNLTASGGLHTVQRLVATGSQSQPTAAQPPLQQQHDSDTDVEHEMPSIESVIPKEQLRKLKPKEKKRQDIINELFYTERSHVRNLKILDKLFHARMAAEPSISADLVKLVFSNIDDVINVHRSMSRAMRQRQKESAVVETVTDILLERFKGKAGDVMKETCAEFCKNRTYALDTLKARRRKDAKLQEVIHAAESSPKCRRLQLYDLLIAEVQRLSKYPLLIQNLLKHTQSGGGSSSSGGAVSNADGAYDEKHALEEALYLSESVVAHVNSAIEECENQHLLQSLQKRLDVSPVQKSTHNLIANFKNLDLTKHRLIAEGPITWRLSNRKSINAHAVLLETVLVLLQVYDEGRLVLACQSASATAAASELSTAHSPVIPLSTILTRDVATDNKAFFIICTAENGPWIYELIACSPQDRKRWFRNITDASEAQRKQMESKGAQQLPTTASRTVAASGGAAAASGADATSATSASYTDGGAQGDGSIGLVGAAAAIGSDGAGNIAAATGYCRGANECNGGGGDGSSSTLGALIHSGRGRRAEEDAEAEVDAVDGHRAAGPLPTVASPRLPQQQASEVDIAQLLYEKDELILRATEEKKQLIASALKLTSHECQGLHLEAANEQERDPRVLVLAAMRELVQVTDMLQSVSTAPRSYVDPIDNGQQMTVVMASLNKRLEMILDVVVEKDAEVERLRDQLRRANRILSLNADNRAESPVRMTPPRTGTHAASTREFNGSRPSSPSSSSDSTSAGCERVANASSTSIVSDSVSQMQGDVSCDSKNESKQEAEYDASKLLLLSAEHGALGGSESYSCQPASSRGVIESRGESSLYGGSLNRGQRVPSESGSCQGLSDGCSAVAQDMYVGQSSAGVRFTIEGDAAAESAASPGATAGHGGLSPVRPAASVEAAAAGSDVLGRCHGGSGSWQLGASLPQWSQHLPETDAVAALLCSEDDSEV